VISLFTLDHPSWWTLMGMAFKYAIILAAVVVGVSFFRASKAGYFIFGWPLVVPLPLVLLTFSEGLFGPFVRPAHESSFVYVWIAIALLEFFLFWIPIAGLWMGPTSDPTDEIGKKAPKNDEDAAVLNALRLYRAGQPVTQSCPACQSQLELRSSQQRETQEVHVSCKCGKANGTYKFTLPEARPIGE